MIFAKLKLIQVDLIYISLKLLIAAKLYETKQKYWLVRGLAL